jgi:hypothetical protein
VILKEFLEAKLLPFLIKLTANLSLKLKFGAELCVCCWPRFWIFFSFTVIGFE